MSWARSRGALPLTGSRSAIPFHTKAVAPLPTEDAAAVPHKVFQTWITHNLRPGMHRTVQHNHATNPEFDFYLFDNAECRDYIETNFEPSVLKAYDSLAPGAYKADLWRLCVLYKEGGVYLDIKLKITEPLVKFLEPVASKQGPIFVKDKWQPVDGGIAPYQAVLAGPPGVPLFRQAIETIVRNVESRYYGTNQLDPTGPVMLARLIGKEERNLFHYYVHFDPKSFQAYIYKNDSTQLFMQQYETYRFEQHQDMLASGGGGGETYLQLWNRRAIYKD